jgi:uncharacterized protein (TIGR03492 family)
VTRLLLVSNGHGEDVIAATLARRLRVAGFDPVATPLVGRGRAYDAADVEVLGPRDEHPSGGYLLSGPRALIGDLRAGWLGSTRARWSSLRAAAGRAAVSRFAGHPAGYPAGHAAGLVAGCVVVGDWYALTSAWANVRVPVFYLPSAISVLAWPPDAPAWRAPFGPWERRLMARAAAVYPRDEATASWLQARAVPGVAYLGNPMLDAIDGDAEVGIDPPYLLLLPGTRGDAGYSLPRMLEACRRLRDEPAAVVAWAGADAPPEADGWALVSTGAPRGVIARYRHPDGTEVAVATGAYATLVAGARAALSTSGTAAEQCAGLGIPIVGFVTPGPQYRETFARAQRRALGDALALTSSAPEELAVAVRRALHDAAARERAKVAGRHAMGVPGGADRVARDIARRLGLAGTDGAAGADAAAGTASAASGRRNGAA